MYALQGLKWVKLLSTGCPTASWGHRTVSIIISLGLPHSGKGSALSLWVSAVQLRGHYLLLPQTSCGWAVQLMPFLGFLTSHDA